MTQYPPSRLEAMSITESLRAGVPTRHSARELPDLRPQLTAFVRDDLEYVRRDENVLGRLIWGQYGQGKSHSLKLIEHMALDAGFAVSSVTLSREISCHDLHRFYTRCACTLRTPHSNLFGLQNLLTDSVLEKLSDSPIGSEGRYDHALPAAILEILLQSKTDEDSHKLYTALVGEDLHITEFRKIARDTAPELASKDLKGFVKSRHAKALFGVMADAVRLCGLAGWVLLIDEIELVGRLGKASRLKAYQNLNWLLNWSGTMRFPIYTIGASATSIQEIWFQASGRRQSDQEEMPRYASDRDKDPSAGEEMKAFFEKAISNKCPKIRPVDRQALGALAESLAAKYSLAHDWTPSKPISMDVIFQSLSKDTPVRTYIRAILESLDQLRLTGEMPSLETAEYTESIPEEDETYFSPDENKATDD